MVVLSKKVGILAKIFHLSHSRCSFYLQVFSFWFLSEVNSGPSMKLTLTNLVLLIKIPSYRLIGLYQKNAIDTSEPILSPDNSMIFGLLKLNPFQPSILLQPSLFMAFLCFCWSVTKWPSPALSYRSALSCLSLETTARTHLHLSSPLPFPFWRRQPGVVLGYLFKYLKMALYLNQTLKWEFDQTFWAPWLFYEQFCRAVGTWVIWSFSVYRLFQSGSNFSVSVDSNCRSALCKTFFGKNNINPKDNKKTEIVKHKIKYTGLEVRINS